VWSGSPRTLYARYSRARCGCVESLSFFEEDRLLNFLKTLFVFASQVFERLPGGLEQPKGLFDAGRFAQVSMTLLTVCFL
jgi:hypothetical protein